MSLYKSTKNKYLSKMDQIEIFCPTLFRKNLDVYEFVV